MARVKYGDGVSGQSGSLNKQAGGVTYLKNNVKRMRVVPTNPRTKNQEIPRTVFTTLTQSWAALTEEQREAWESARTDQYWFVKDGFYGVSKAANSAKALFIQVNFNMLQAAGSLLTPSVVASVPPPTKPSDTLAVSSVAVDESANTFILTYTGTTANDAIFVRMTPAVSPGNMRLKAVESKLRVSDTAASASPATIVKPDTISYTGQTGQKVFYVVEAIGTDTGKKRIIGTGTTIIVA